MLQGLKRQVWVVLLLQRLKGLILLQNSPLFESVTGSLDGIGVGRPNLDLGDTSGRRGSMSDQNFA